MNESANDEISLIQKLNKLSMPELATFVQTTQNKHWQKVASILYSNKKKILDAHASRQTPQKHKFYCDSADKYLNW